MSRPDLVAAVEAATGEPVAALSPVSGGDVAEAYRVDLAGGGRRFVKTHTDPPPGAFTTEAAGLAWLREAEAVAVPEVIAVADGDGGGPVFLLLEWIEPGHRTETTEVDLGGALAALHAAGAPSFGREDRRTTGSRGLPNEPHPTWAAAYAGNRLLPLARIAADEGALPEQTIRDLDRLAGTLDRFDTGEPPARLHGDLWAGNRLVDRDGRSWLLDPAAHGGHAEHDLAVMRLFGGFGADCFAAYAANRPLADGWEERVELHQVAPLVVHAIKFGGGYVGAATAAITRYA